MKHLPFLSISLIAVLLIGCLTSTVVSAYSSDDIENDNTDWSFTAGASISTDYAHSGTNSIKIIDADWPSNSIYAQHPLVIGPTGNYTISYYIYAKSGTTDWGSFEFCRIIHGPRLNLIANGGIQLQYSNYAGSFVDVGISGEDITKDTWHLMKLNVTEFTKFTLSIDSTTVGPLNGYAGGTFDGYWRAGVFSANSEGFAYFDDFSVIGDAYFGSEFPVTSNWGPTYTSTPSVSGQVGSSYTYTPTTNESATITAPTLPAWASYSGGVISGTPSAAGTYDFSLQAVSTAGTLSSWQNWTVTVSEAFKPWVASFTSTPPDSVELGDTYNYTPSCNETATFELESYPAWAGWVDGGIIGLPNEVGSYDFSLRADSTAGTLSSWQNWTVTVSESIPVPVITGDPETNATKRVWYSFEPSVDLPNCYWTVTGAGWLSINQFSGKVSGLPTSAGTYNITITAVSTEYGTSTGLNYLLTVADVLEPPIDAGDDTTDPGGSDDPGTTITGLSERMVLTILVIVVIALVAVALVARRR